jgi:rRNA maturation endonuclease Nob1
MYAEISAAIQSTKTLADLLKVARSLSNYNELVLAVSEVNMKLMEATAVALKSQERQAELQTMVTELERKAADLQLALDRAKDYQLHKFETGALAYSYIGTTEQVPPHSLCATCFDRGSHSKLQPQGNYALKCHACDSIVQVKFTPPPQATRRKVGSFTRD